MPDGDDTTTTIQPTERTGNDIRTADGSNEDMGTGTALKLSVVECLRLVRDAMAEATPQDTTDMMTGDDPLGAVAGCIMRGVDGASADDRRTVALAALQAVSMELDPTADGARHTDLTRIRAAVRHMTGVAAAAHRTGPKREGGTAAAAAPQPTTTTATALRALALSVGDATARQEANDQRVNAAATPVTPFHEDRIDRRALGGMDIMISRATNNQITRAEDLFRRLGTAERRVAELEAEQRHQPATGGSAGDAHPNAEAPRAEPSGWRRRATRLADVFPAARIFLRERADGEENQPTIDVAKLLETMVPLLLGGDESRVPKVDEHYVFDARTLATAMHAIRTRRNLCLVGPTGSGKTKFLEQLAARLRRPYVRISVDGEMRRREIIGGLQQVVTDKGSKTAWYDGLLTVGIGMPSIINLDEIDRADPDMLYAASQVLEGNGIQLLEDGNRHIPMHPWCVIASTGNTKGQADANGLYASTGEMSEASRDRLNLWVDHEYMDQEAEIEMIIAKVPGTTREDARAITDVAGDIRIAMRDGRLRTACSPRTTVTAAEYLADMLPLMSGTTTAKAKMACLADVLARRARDPFDAQAITKMIENRLNGANA